MVLCPICLVFIHLVFDFIFTVSVSCTFGVLGLLVLFLLPPTSCFGCFCGQGSEIFMSELSSNWIQFWQGVKCLLAVDNIGCFGLLYWKAVSETDL